jgi:hypothetical protein
MTREIMNQPLDDSNTFPIEVYVTVSPHGGATCTCAPVQADLPSLPGVTLSYTLNAPTGWVFPTSGAVVVASPADQFPDPSITAPDGMSATLFDANTDSNLYNYTVCVVKTATGETCRHDPAIKNGGVSMCGPDA